MQAASRAIGRVHDDIHLALHLDVQLVPGVLAQHAELMVDLAGRVHVPGCDPRVQEGDQSWVA